MPKKPVKARKKRARSLAFGRILGELQLTERGAADLLAVPYSRISNILRGNSSVDDELCLQIQAATGISAASLMRGDNPPVMLNGKKITKELFVSWKEKPVSEENKRSQVDEIGLMSALLLEAAGAKGDHLRRRTYHLLRSLLEEMRKSSGLSMGEINETARMGATLTSSQVTRDQLDIAIGKAPAYQAIRSSLPVKELIPVITEAFPTWCDVSSFSHLVPEVPDNMQMTRVIYRIQVGELWHQVIADQYRGVGTGSPQRARKLKESVGKIISIQEIGGK